MDTNKCVGSPLLEQSYSSNMFWTPSYMDTVASCSRESLLEHTEVGMHFGTACFRSIGRHVRQPRTLLPSVLPPRRRTRCLEAGPRGQPADVRAPERGAPAPRRVRDQEPVGDAAQRRRALPSRRLLPPRRRQLRPARLDRAGAGRTQSLSCRSAGRYLGGRWPPCVVHVRDCTDCSGGAWGISSSWLQLWCLQPELRWCGLTRGLPSGLFLSSRASHG